MLPVLGCLLASFVGGALSAAVAPLSLTVQWDATRECKACPYIGCVNKYYPGLDGDEDYNVTATCWTSGQAINNLTLWVKTTDNCYFNEWDLRVEDTQDLRASLPSCGYVPPVITEVKAKTKYVTECAVHPEQEWSESVYTAKWYKPNVDLTLTCKTTNVNSTGIVDIFGDRTWYRTKHSYCFVHQKLLQDVKGANKLPDCGPIIGNLNTGNRDPDPAARRKIQKPAPWYKTPKNTSKTKKIRPPTKKRTVFNRLSRRGLFRNTVNEDGVVCRAEPGNSSAIIKSYPYGRQIVAQCGQYLDAGLSGIGIYTTDNCWVNDSDMEIMIEDETNNIKTYLKYCDYYVDMQEWLPTDTWGCGQTVDC